MIRKLVIAAAIAAASLGAQANTLLSEGFEDVANLSVVRQWVQTNLSSPVGLAWGQGFVGPFAAQAGAANSYAVANFESAAFGSGGVIDNWLITPSMQFAAVTHTVTFWTRTVFNPSIFPDRLEVRLSLAGGSSDTATFNTVLVSVNPDLTQVGYPNEWTQYSASFTVAAFTFGRLAFRYTVPNSFNADFIGLDSVTVTSVPEPQAALLMLGGLGALLSVRRRARSS